MPLVRITSPKHPGAIFFKVRGSEDNFIAKFYPGHEDAARLFEQSWIGMEAVQQASLETERVRPPRWNRKA